MTRNRAILKAYLAGATYAALAREHGLTRERIRQIVGKIGPKNAAAQSIAARGGRYSPEGLARHREIDHFKRPEVHPDRNRGIEAWLACGMSYSQIAQQFGVTRNTIAGAAYRARHRGETVGARP